MMADQAKFEAIKTQEIEPEYTSLSSTDESNETGDEIGVGLEALSRWQASKVFGAVMDVLAIVLSCMFFAYALAVKTHEGMSKESAQVKLLMRLSNLVSTRSRSQSVSGTSAFVGHD